MRRIPWSRAAAVFGLAPVVLFAGCGGGSSGGTSQPLTQQQALAITGDMFEALANAPLVAGGAPQAERLNEAAHVRSASLGSAEECRDRGTR